MLNAEISNVIELQKAIVAHDNLLCTLKFLGPEESKKLTEQISKMIDEIDRRLNS
jgi:hypothetical protein